MLFKCSINFFLLHLRNRLHKKVFNMSTSFESRYTSSPKYVNQYSTQQLREEFLTNNLMEEDVIVGSAVPRKELTLDVIDPGCFATEQTEPIRIEGHPFNNFIINRIPVENWVDPNNLVESAIFLASKAHEFVNGHILYVDGGFSQLLINFQMKNKIN